MARHVLEVLGWLPVSDNKISGHWTARHKAKKADQQVVATAAYDQRIPKAKGKRRIEVHYTQTGKGRPRDPWNMYKSLFDALVKCGLLMDDSDKWLEVLPAKSVRGKHRATCVILEDIIEDGGAFADDVKNLGGPHQGGA